MSTTTIKNILATTAFGLVAGISLNAGAGTVDETVVHATALPAQTISFHRTELATAEGREAVERRIEKAAENVCGSLNVREVGSMSRVARNKECFDGAVAQAMSQVDRSQVASVD